MQALRVERDGELLRVTLARPERRNAFDAELILELTEAFSDVGDARAVVLSGDGPSFCAGADVEWQRSSIDLTFDENVEDALRLHRMMAAVDGCPAPVVVRVQGYALGGGSGLVACADIAVATPDATFGFTEVRLGIIPAVISPFVLAKIGPGAARHLFLTGSRFDAETALRIGLVHEVTDELDAAVERQVGELLKSGPEASRAAKRLASEPVAGAEELARLAAALRAGAEGQEGLRAFLEKRDPSWRSASSS
jgi:enoyl-CoA hydratase/carnithine racemase